MSDEVWFLAHMQYFLLITFGLLFFKLSFIYSLNKLLQTFCAQNNTENSWHFKKTLRLINSREVILSNSLRIPKWFQERISNVWLEIYTIPFLNISINFFFFLSHTFQLRPRNSMSKNQQRLFGTYFPGCMFYLTNTERNLW